MKYVTEIFGYDSNVIIDNKYRKKYLCPFELGDVPCDPVNKKSKPVYETLGGWDKLTPDMIKKGFKSLPDTLQQYVKYIEDQVGCRVSIISIGPQRHETIIR